MLFRVTMLLIVGHTAHKNAECGYSAKRIVLSLFYIVTNIASAVLQSP